MAHERPNILFIQCDQMSGLVLPMLGHRVVKAPRLEALAGEGVLFANAYCNFPICAPSRFSMLAGRLGSEIGAYDNGAELPASVPTFAHYARALGYQTTLAGKMHFVGPDQLHGFEERLTTDIYPADFYWTPSWDAGVERYPFERGGGVTGVDNLADSGVCVRSMQLDYDEEVAHHAVGKIFDLARATDRRPFLLAASFTHPHDPYVARAEHWSRYRDEDIDPPAVAPIGFESRDPHSQLHFRHIGLDRGAPDEALVRRVRRGYYANVSYVDDLVGRLLDALRATGLIDRTVVIFTSDHGDMLGERGMWYKQTFYEWAMRVPLIVSWPERFGARISRANVSLVDLLPTIVGLAGGDGERIVDPCDGASLVPLLEGDESGWPDAVHAEHLSDAAYASRVMIRRGRYKYVASSRFPAMLHDLEADPHEREDLAARPELADVRAGFEREVAKRWSLDELDADIEASQRRRRFVQAALCEGRYRPWDFQPHADASNRFVRMGSGFPDVERKHLL